jgi:arylsulfatase A-like enzyme
MREHGLLTAGFVGGGKVSERFGFGKGFDVYEDVSRLKTDKEEWEHRRIPELERLSFEWLDTHHDRDFFLFLHTYKVHCPYDPPEELARKYTDDYRGGEYRCGVKREGLTLDDEYFEYVSALYAGEVEYVDAFIGRVVEHLKDLAIYDDTMIVILSDHGELLGEQGKIGHNSIHDACLRVPLIIRVPGLAARKIDSPVALIDVIPTILAAVGADAPYPFQGENLLPMMRGEEEVDPERARFATAEGKIAIRSGRWKLVFDSARQDETALYDLSRDAEEIDDVAGTHADRVERMRGLFDRMLADAGVDGRFVLTGDEEEQVVDERVLEQLRTLGYVE